MKRFRVEPPYFRYRAHPRLSRRIGRDPEAARDFVVAGGLMSYGVSYPDLYYRAAGYADCIFKGAAPGELAIERPAKFELFLNRRTAHALGLVIPPDLLLKSDRVVG